MPLIDLIIIDEKPLIQRRNLLRPLHIEVLPLGKKESLQVAIETPAL